MTTNLAWLTSAGNGIAHGALTSQMQSNEKVFFKGRSYYLASLYQQVGVSQAFSQCGTIFASVMQNRSVLLSAPISFTLSSLYFVTHSLVFFSALIKNSQISSGKSVCDAPYHFIEAKADRVTLHKVRQIADLTARHIGDAVQIVNVAFAGFKYYQGLKAEAIASLVIMGIGLLDRNNCLHQKISELFNRALPTISSVGIILSVSPLLFKVAATAILVNELLPSLTKLIRNSMDRSFHYYYSTYGAQYPDLKSLAQPFKLPENTELDLDVEASKVEVNFDHLTFQPTLDYDTTGITFDDFYSCYESIDWKKEKHFEALENVLLEDKEMVEYFNDMFSLSSPTTNNVIIKNPRSFVKEHMPRYTFNPEIVEAKKQWEKLLRDHFDKRVTLFIDNLNGKNRPPGDLSGLQEVKERALQVITFLKRLSNDKEDELLLKREIIFELALNGSDYSFHMMRIAINKCYDRILSNTTQKTTSITGRILHSLQQKRMEIVKTWYDRIQANSPVSFDWLLGFSIKSDPHIFNEFYNFIYNGLGLDEGKLGHDRTVEYIPPLGYFVRTIMPYYRHAFFAPSPYGTEDKVESSKQTLDIMHVATKSLKATIFGKEGQTAYSRGCNLLKGVYTVPRDAFRLMNATIFLYFEAIAGDYRYDAKTVLKTFHENLGKTFTQNEVDNWWANKLSENPNKAEILDQKAADPDKFALVMLIDMGILKSRSSPREIHSFELKSNLFDQVTEYVSA